MLYSFLARLFSLWSGFYTSGDVSGLSRERENAGQYFASGDLHPAAGLLAGGIAMAGEILT
jgi:hypothetical protein